MHIVSLRKHKAPKKEATFVVLLGEASKQKVQHIKALSANSVLRLKTA